MKKQITETKSLTITISQTGNTIKTEVKGDFKNDYEVLGVLEMCVVRLKCDMIASERNQNP